MIIAAHNPGMILVWIEWPCASHSIIQHDLGLFHAICGVMKCDQWLGKALQSNTSWESYRILFGHGLNHWTPSEMHFIPETIKNGAESQG